MFRYKDKILVFCTFCGKRIAFKQDWTECTQEEQESLFMQITQGDKHKSSTDADAQKSKSHAQHSTETVQETALSEIKAQLMSQDELGTINTAKSTTQSVTAHGLNPLEKSSSKPVSSPGTDEKSVAESVRTKSKDVETGRKSVAKSGTDADDNFSASASSDLKSSGSGLGVSEPVPPPPTSSSKPSDDISISKKKKPWKDDIGTSGKKKLSDSPTSPAPATATDDDGETIKSTIKSSERDHKTSSPAFKHSPSKSAKSGKSKSKKRGADISKKSGKGAGTGVDSGAKRGVSSPGDDSSVREKKPFIPWKNAKKSKGNKSGASPAQSPAGSDRISLHSEKSSKKSSGKSPKKAHGVHKRNLSSVKSSGTALKQSYEQYKKKKHKEY